MKPAFLFAIPMLATCAGVHAQTDILDIQMPALRPDALPMQAGELPGGRQTGSITLPVATAMVPIAPDLHAADGVRHVCGDASIATGYDLMVTIAAENNKGPVPSDVRVAVIDERGQTMLSGSCAGPVLLVDLPVGGAYRISAEAGGATVTRYTSVSDGKLQRIGITLPDAAPRRVPVLTAEERLRAISEMRSVGDSGAGSAASGSR